MRYFSIALALGVAFVFGGCGKTGLPLKLVPGSSAVLTQETDRTIALEGRDGHARHQQTARYRLEILEATERGARVKVTIDDMTTQMDVPASWGEHGQHEEAIAVLARGLTFEMLMTPDGDISEVAGAEELVAKISRGLQRPGLDPAQARVVVEQQFSRQSLHEMFQNLFAHYPEGRVRVGSQWNQTQQHSAGMPFLSECTYTLAALDDDTAHIEYTAEIKPNFTRALVAMGMQYTVSGREEGSFLVDRHTGWTRASDSSYTLTSEVKSTTTTVTGVEKTATVAHGAE